MATAKLLDRVKMSVSGTPGTGSITLGSAAAKYQSVTDAGGTNGDTLSYLIDDGMNWETGVGTYNAGVLSRDTVFASSAAGAKITATGTAIVYITVLAKDIQSGTAANQLVRLDGSAKLPAVDGSALTNLAAAAIVGTLGLSEGGTGATDATGARSNLGLGTAATAASTSFLQVANNLSEVTPATARTNLGLGTAATLASSAVLQAANNLSDLASNVTARTNLGLGSLATLSSINNSNWSGTQLSVANGGTGLTSLTAGYILFGNGTSAFSSSSSVRYDGYGLVVGSSNNPGNRTLSVNTIMSLQDGTTERGYMYWDSGSSSIQLVASGAPHFTFWTGNTERMRITSAGDVLIGTTSTGGILRAYGASGRLIIGDSGYNYYDANTHNFRNYAGTVNMQLTSDGNLGLGVSPSAWNTNVKTYQSTRGGVYSDNGYYNAFGIAQNSYWGTASGTDWRYLTAAAAARYEMSGSAGAGTHAWYTAASGTAGSAISFTQAMTLDASGNLGIGTSSPGAKLHVNGATILGSPSTFYVGDDGSSGGAFLNQTAAQPLRFLTSGTERARIDSSGNLLVGGQTATYSDGIFDVDSQRVGNAVGIRASSASFAANALIIYADRNTTNGTFYALSYYNPGAGAYKFRVADSGNVTNTNNSYGQISDIKLKQDIVDASSQWNDIKALRVRKFRFKNDPTGFLQIGVIAQEIEQTSPGLIDEQTDKDAKGNDLGTVTKTVKYSVLYMKAVKALQEAMARIEALEAKVNG